MKFMQFLLLVALGEDFKIDDKFPVFHNIFPYQRLLSQQARSNQQSRRST
jgi:hypothetical protein